MDTYIGLLNKLLDHPVDGDGSDNNVKKQDSEEALSGKEAKQSVAGKLLSAHHYLSMLKADLLIHVYSKIYICFDP